MHNNFLPLGRYQIKEEESTKESKSCQACQALELVYQPKSFYNMIVSSLHALFMIETPWIWSNSRVNRLYPIWQLKQIEDESHFLMYCIKCSILRDQKNWKYRSEFYK